jgi:hypothetical protein
MFAKKPNITTISQRLALVCVMLLLSAQTVALAHAHETAAEAVCAICTVSGDDAPIAGSVVASDHFAPAAVTASRTVQPGNCAPHRPFQPRAPPLL